MSIKPGASRRQFLRVGAGGLLGLAGVSLLAACQPQAPTAPTIVQATPKRLGREDPQ